MAYRIVTVDLTLLADRREIVPRNLTVTSITVLSLTGAATFNLHLGQREGIPVADRGLEIHGLCPPEINGIFVSHAAQAGAVAVLYVDFGSSSVTLEP